MLCWEANRTNTKNGSNLQPGQKIEHQKFGFGEVIKMEGAAHNPIATVKFENNGEKKIMLNYAKLRIVE
jgi:DNA helicase-2/ATP-dependent DNA helicase PcrA